MAKEDEERGGPPLMIMERRSSAEISRAPSLLQQPLSRANNWSGALFVCPSHCSGILNWTNQDDWRQRRRRFCCPSSQYVSTCCCFLARVSRVLLRVPPTLSFLRPIPSSALFLWVNHSLLFLLRFTPVVWFIPVSRYSTVGWGGRGERGEMGTSFCRSKVGHIFLLGPPLIILSTPMLVRSLLPLPESFLLFSTTYFMKCVAPVRSPCQWPLVTRQKRGRGTARVSSRWCFGN